MVVVSHLFFFYWINFRGRRDSYESRLPLFRTVYFPTAPFRIIISIHPVIILHTGRAFLLTKMM